MNIGSASSYYLPSPLQAFDPTKAQLKSTLEACIACASSKTSSGQQNINNLETQLNAPVQVNSASDTYVYNNKAIDPVALANAQNTVLGLNIAGGLINVFA